MGRYEGAIPILKRNVASYPNMLASHYLLAVDYIELGREPQARAEAAEILRISPNFSVSAFILGFPNKDETYKERARNDLRKGGLK
jgi:tetratricopeptide (TPR) repeat protein